MIPYTAARPENSPHDAEEAPADAEVANQLAALRSEIGTVPLRLLLDHAAVRPRVRRVLESPVGALKTAAAIDDLEGLRRKVVRLATIGNDTADQLVLKMRRAVSTHLRESGRTLPMHDALMAAWFGGRSVPSLRAQDVDGKRSMAAQILHKVLGNDRCEIAFEGRVNIHVRLRLLVSAKNVGDRYIVHALLDRVGFDHELQRVPNVGHKAIGQFWDLLWRHLALCLTTASVANDDCIAVSALLAIDPRRLVAHPVDLVKHSPVLARSEADWVMTSAGLDNLLEAIIERVRTRDAAVIRRHFGLGCPPETLAKIGVSVGLTPQRILQLKKRGLHTMRRISSSMNLDLIGALNAEWERAWGVLAGGEDIVSDVKLEELRRNIPGSLTLAMKVVGVDLLDEVSVIARR